GRYRNPMCGFGLAAVCARAVQAGTIASSSGRPIVTPAPRRNVRRERCIFVMNIGAPEPEMADCGLPTADWHCRFAHGRFQIDYFRASLPTCFPASAFIVSAGAVRIRNGALLTMPRTIDEKR